MAEEGAFRRAARRLQIAQPPLSQAIRQLELELGVPLLIRSTRGVELTTAGAQLVEHAREILSRVEDAISAVRQETASGFLRVGLVGGMLAAAELTGPILQSFQMAHPKLQLSLCELNFAEQTEPLARGAVDVAIVRPPYHDRRIDMFPVLGEPRELFVSTRHPLSTADEVRVDDILDEPMLDMSRAPAEWSAFWLLDELRDGPAPGHGRIDAVTVHEFELALALRRGALTVAASVPRLAPNPMLVGIPLRDASPSMIAVARRRGDRRIAVTEFIRHAGVICRLQHDLVPDAVLP
ncbi:LysR family transcriptional regulator [Pseudonocardia bannensis]